jgi:Holliday junction resolvase-like predicted endonuclease
MTQEVVKASGAVEEFNRGKLLQSLLKSGVAPDIADDVANKVIAAVGPHTSTRKIFRLARKHLRRHDRTCGMRYGIKKAIFDLGPSGYPFEKYVARMFEGLGYKTQVGRTIQGFCVKHEVDVVARKEKKCHLVECKFHVNGGAASDVKTALYVWARFQDIGKIWQNNSAGEVLGKCWLVTNTRFTSDAVQFANCTGLKAIGWKFPRGESLENLIEAERLYPVTIFGGITRHVLDALLRRDLILARDLYSTGTEELASLTGLDMQTLHRLKTQAGELCR